MDLLAALAEHGMLLESAKGPLPNVAEMIVGAPIKGSWWGHPEGTRIFNALNVLAESPDVVRTRLVGRRVTLIHRRLWAALVVVADGLPVERLAAIHEEHTASGAHRMHEQPFPDWVPDDVVQQAAELSAEDAWAALPDCVRPRRSD